MAKLKLDKDGYPLWHPALYDVEYVEALVDYLRSHPDSAEARDDLKNWTAPYNEEASSLSKRSLSNARRVEIRKEFGL